MRLQMRLGRVSPQARGLAMGVLQRVEALGCLAGGVRWLISGSPLSCWRRVPLSQSSRCGSGGTVTGLSILAAWRRSVCERRVTSLREIAMTHVAMGEIGELRAAMKGPVIAPGDPGFDEGRRVWNAQIDRRPSVIARCASAAD